MFVLKSIGGLIWGSQSSPDLIKVPSGQLNIIRFNSVKSPRECILPECSATIRRTPHDFQYQLIVTRVVDEDDNVEDEELDSEEYIFLIDECMKFSKGQHENLTSFKWVGPSSSADEMFEFVCDQSITAATANTFERTLLECMYQRKYRRTHENAADEEIYALAVPSPNFKSPTAASAGNNVPSGKGRVIRSSEPQTPTPSARQTSSKQSTPSATPTSSNTTNGAETTVLPTAQNLPSGDTLLTCNAEFYLFDANSKTFIIQNPTIAVTITQAAPFVYWLSLASSGNMIHCQKIEPLMNPFFEDQHKAFIWNYYDDAGRVFSLSLKFSDSQNYESFKQRQNECLFEVMNQESFSKLKEDDQSYVMKGVYSEDVEMEDAERLDDDEEQSDENVSEEEDEEEYYSDSETEGPKGSSKNSLLDISHLHHRSFVVRGDKIGVFKQTPSSLEFKTTINTPFSPSKTLLHNTDQSLVLMNPNDQHTLSHMDLETGKIVSNWQVHDVVPVTDIVHDAKFSNETGNQTFIGLSDNQIFRIDPRQKENKLKESEWKTYASKVGFNCGSTNEKGELVVGDAKGELRFFNKLGIRAKTNLPGLGDPIIGIDVTSSGHYVIATCKTYLLLVSTLHPDSSTSAFTKAFPKAEKPAPIRLQLKPHHLALLQCPLSFTPAIFNSSPSTQETSIVTSTGPYVITWNLTSIEKGRLYDYSIKKYPERVVMDRFGSTLGGSLSSGAGKASVGGKKVDTQPIVVALENDVKMIRRGDLKAVEKVVGTPVRGRVKGNGVVNSPW
ncbi:VID27 cytoplasmic protein-domain-containing protein [Paraphysoderma sedebokerense]|nr:VID27 cytoplasmic protein-domain-containing protein [Paraphysoderma sedebokerense]